MNKSPTNEIGITNSVEFVIYITECYIRVNVINQTLALGKK